MVYALTHSPLLYPVYCPVLTAATISSQKKHESSVFFLLTPFVPCPHELGEGLVLLPVLALILPRLRLVGVMIYKWALLGHCPRKCIYTLSVVRQLDSRLLCMNHTTVTCRSVPCRRRPPAMRTGRASGPHQHDNSIKFLQDLFITCYFGWLL